MAGSNPVPGQRKWSNNLMFLAAAIGSAVGISNVWKFTYVAGENGGGAFVLVYILAIVFVALPALIAEFLIGRRGGASVVKTMDNLRQRGRHKPYLAILRSDGRDRSVHRTQFLQRHCRLDH